MLYIVFVFKTPLKPLSALKFMVDRKTACVFLTTVHPDRRYMVVRVDESKSHELGLAGSFTVKIAPSVEVNGIPRSASIHTYWANQGVFQDFSTVSAVSDREDWCRCFAQELHVTSVDSLSSTALRDLTRLCNMPPQPPAKRAKTVHAEHAVQSSHESSPKLVVMVAEPLKHLSVQMRKDALSTFHGMLHSSWGADRAHICVVVELQMCSRVRRENPRFNDYSYGRVFEQTRASVSSRSLDCHVQASHHFLVRMQPKPNPCYEPVFHTKCWIKPDARVFLIRALEKQVGNELGRELECWASKVDTLATANERTVLLSKLKKGCDIPEELAAGLSASLLSRVREAVGETQADVVVTGEKSWQERDQELRSQAVLLE